MADLSATVSLRYGRSPIMPPNPALIVNLDVGEAPRLAESLSRAIMLAVSVQESMHASANTVSRILDQAGVAEFAFVASPDQAVVTDYTARLRVYGTSTVIATLSLGVPTPDGNGVIVTDITSLLSGQPSGTY